MKKIAKQLALFVLVMFGLQASARTCAFMQVGGGIEEAALSKVVSIPKSAGPSSPQSALPLGDSRLKSGSVSSTAQSSPGYTFKKATSVVSGRRDMIVAKSENKFYAATMQVVNSSDLQSVEVIVNNDTISPTKNDLAFTFEGYDKGFVIWQSNGSYLTNTNTNDYTRIKWSRASNKSQGVWIVDDRESYTNIQNTKSQRYFFFSDNRKIFLAYKNNSSKNINLYEEILTEVPVSVSSVGYATLYYEDRALKVPDGVTAMTYAYNVSAQSLVVSKTYEAGSVIPAGVAVVLKAQPGEYTFTVSDEAGEKPKSTNLYGYNVPSTTSVYGMSKYYMLSLNAKNDLNSVGFYWGVENGTAFNSEAHKAFLALPESATAKSFTFADIADGIASVSRCSDDSDSPVYSLTGIRMSGKLPAGIYVRGGKKFIVR